MIDVHVRNEPVRCAHERPRLGPQIKPPRFNSGIRQYVCTAAREYPSIVRFPCFSVRIGWSQDIAFPQSFPGLILAEFPPLGTTAPVGLRSSPGKLASQLAPRHEMGILPPPANPDKAPCRCGRGTSWPHSTLSFGFRSGLQLLLTFNRLGATIGRRAIAKYKPDFPKKLGLFDADFSKDHKLQNGKQHIDQNGRGSPRPG